MSLLIILNVVKAFNRIHLIFIGVLPNFYVYFEVTMWIIYMSNGYILLQLEASILILMLTLENLEIGNIILFQILLFY